MKPLLFGTFALVASAAWAQAIDLVPFGSTWDYMHPTDGVDPAVADTDFDTTWYLAATEFGTTYNGPSFANPAVGFDAGSGAAPIGYDNITFFQNNGGLATELTKPPGDNRYTAYLRHDFNVAADVDNLALEILADDAAVIYIDGVLWQEVNFAGPDTYTAGTPSTGDENAPVLRTVGLGGLAAGDHTIAVSLHQHNPNSSDLGFDLRLSDGGTATPRFGFNELAGGPAQDVFLTGVPTVWEIPAERVFVLNNGDPGVLASEQAPIEGTIPGLFVIDLTASETSGGTNFEDEDSFSASVEFDDGMGGTTVVSLVPPALDTDGGGTLNGEEFGAGIDAASQVFFFRPLVVPVPDGSVGGTVRVSAINNSDSETFEIRNARFFPAPSPPLTVMGQIDFGVPVDFNVLYAADAWATTATPGEFVLNDVPEQAAILSQTIDLTGMPQARVSLNLEAAETSETSNFDGPAAFTAWVEVIDSEGGGWKIELVNGGLDADGNHRLENEEFAPGADVAEMLDLDIPLAARLPANAVTAQIVVVGTAGSATETLTLSGVSITAAPPVSGGFAITQIAPGAGGGYEITWESEAGVTYDLQFSTDATAGSYANVGSLTATGSSASLAHDPGAATTGIYRVSRRP